MEARRRLPALSPVEAGLPARPVLAWLLLLGLAVAALGARTRLDPGGIGGGLFDDWLYNGVLVGSAVTCLARGVLVARERAAWLLLGSGLALWTLGDVYWAVALADLDTVPFPSAADWLYLSFYPPTYLALGLLIRSRIGAFARVVWLDGLIAALAVAAVAAAIVFDAVHDATGGSRTAVAVNLAYPLGDALLLAVLVTAIALSGWRRGAGWWRLGAGLALFAVADSVYLFQAARETYVEGGLVDLGWAGGAALMAWAASAPAPARARSALEGGAFLVPSTFALSSLAVLVVDHWHRVSTVALALSTASLLAATARLALTVLENRSMLERSRREAHTDALTGLGNRRRLQRDFAALDVDGDRALVLALFDLDGFKHYNDTFGHPAGDALLARLGRQLESFAGGRATAYRMGGDEFCLLAEPGDAPVSALLAGAEQALSAAGEGFTVGPSHGYVLLPQEARTFEEALRLADGRLYADKQSARFPADVQSAGVLVRALAERDPDLGDHLLAVAELAHAVAARLGLPGEERSSVRTAALIHDVGKMAIPDAIVSKPGPLTPDEEAFVRRHPAIGERILLGAPSLARAAGLVRSSHERWDGGGYPDGLAGEDIPLGARILFVCDAFDAMISRRPYSEPMTPQAAVAELVRCAGSQFDPAVVEAFRLVLAERAAAVEAAVAGRCAPRERHARAPGAPTG